MKIITMSDHGRQIHQKRCKQTEEGTRREMASSRRVSNDVISQPLLSAPLCSAVGLGGLSSCLFGVKQPNEQQAEVRNVAPTALPPDYHTKTYLCVFTHLSVCLRAHACPVRIMLLWGNLASFASKTNTHTHAQMHRRTSTSVMRSEESKSKEPQHCSELG